MLCELFVRSELLKAPASLIFAMKFEALKETQKARIDLLKDRIGLLAVRTAGIVYEPIADAICAGKGVSALIALDRLASIRGQQLIADPTPQIVRKPLSDLVFHDNSAQCINSCRCG
jgi:hypothetical protein